MERLAGRLVKVRETDELQTAILMRIDGILQGIAAENRALLRRDGRQNRELKGLGDRLAAAGQALTGRHGYCSLLAGLHRHTARFPWKRIASACGLDTTD